MVLRKTESIFMCSHTLDWFTKKSILLAQPKEANMAQEKPKSLCPYCHEQVSGGGCQNDREANVCPLNSGLPEESRPERPD
jgi:hypothetical protein